MPEIDGSRLWIYDQFMQPATLEPLLCPRPLKLDPLSDPLKDLVKRFLGESESEKRALAIASVPETYEGLRQLKRSGNWRAAVNLSGRLLNAYAGQRISADCLMLP